MSKVYFSDMHVHMGDSLLNKFSRLLTAAGLDDIDFKDKIPIIPDVGLFASLDPVALDMACADAANAQPVVPGSAADIREENDCSHDVFKVLHPDTDWEIGLLHASKLGVGTTEYELIKIK